MFGISMGSTLRIGGPGHIVEIDESALVWQKHNDGHPVKTQWVFGGLDTDSGWLSSYCRQERCRYSVTSLAGVYAASNNSSFRLMENLSHNQQLRLPVSDSKPQASFC